MKRRVYDTAAHRKARKYVKGKPCVVCGTLNNITADHIVSLYNGGTSTLDNYQPMCRTHNTKKRNAEARARGPKRRKKRSRWRNNAY